jgi:16S rRNA (cytosine1402-N4)-methyltransferase
MTKSNERHVPVLLQEAIDFLQVRADGTYVDCTLGLAGHAEAVLRRLGPQGHLIAFDRDAEALELAKSRLAQVTSELGGEAARITLINEASVLLQVM